MFSPDFPLGSHYVVLFETDKLLAMLMALLALSGGTSDTPRS